ncbi:DUF602-domain-containing protein, related [Eimeria tenella]|uniref:DUF602-domain-containing protein, related n=1 Tax=Eimeria tenella TaxID=5802 RepID=H9B935_EIMTE|nr:DUF602-domain-containing protein, related [Eimeria tenella]AET50495.1 hypothetical protein [Eimeria tenella]CDJ45345.1 DUF602-domain-containing protein, related [Eimeria tenella]|eukprot:XP_013236091.1 DUF602-domain-containing protein, related [Eimeria tenella]
MGGDGGSFSGRAEMVRTKGFKFLRNLGGMGYTPNTQIRAADERFGKNENRDIRTRACAYSAEKLKPPLLACRIGRLYNKEAVIKALLEKTLPPHMRHIKSLKDMKDCDVEINAETGFPVCAVTKADLSSGVRGCIIWPCGHVVSNRALDAMTQKDGEGSRPDVGNNQSGKPKIRGVFTCPMCSKEHNAEEDLIPLSPDEEETVALLEKALANRAVKEKKKNAKTPAGGEPEAAGPSSASTSPPDNTKQIEKPSPPQSNAETEKEELRGVFVPKRLRDWVLESEPVVLPTSTAKRRKAAA